MALWLRRTAPLIAIACSATALTAAPALALEAPSVRAVSSGDFSERVERLRIGGQEGEGEKVVMSLRPSRVRAQGGDRLELSTELQVTVDCDEPSRRCLGSPYHYNPVVSVRMLLSPGRSIRGSRQVGAVQRAICRQRLPYREHHCVITMQRTIPRLAEGGGCPDRGCFVNLAASAHSPRARPGEFVAIGGLRPNGTVPQDRGRLDALRISPAGEPRERRYRTKRRLDRSLVLNQSRELLYSQPLRGLEAGEQLAVEGEAVIDISHLPFDVVLSSQLILTDSPSATTRGEAAEVASLRGEITEGNGFNCTRNRRTCTIEKLGVLSMKRDARGPLYVSLVTRAGPKRASADGGQRALSRRGGGLIVRRFRADDSG